MNKRCIIGIACWVMGTCAATAEPERSITHCNHSYQIGIGPTQLLDTYLSQEKFSGNGITFLSSSERYKKPYNYWRKLVYHQLSLSSANDRSESRNELQGDYSVFIGSAYNHRICIWGNQENAFYIQAGGYVNANLGFIYNTSNSNNPAQARASINLMPMVAGICHVQLFKHRLETRYELALPLVGLAFSPNYGQSYYEIFSLGSYDHNLVPTTFISAPNFRQQFTIDYQLWKNSSLRIGYLGDYQQMQVNNLKSHIYRHHFMIGWAHRFTISKKR